VPGVIGSKPPHFLGAGERDKVIAVDKMYIDVGASSRADVETLGVRVGDPVAPHSEWLEMGVDGVLSSKAFDDRVGVGLLCETMTALAGTSLPGTLVGVAAVQEEVGCRGAVTASAVSRPDVAIVLEGTPADDLPGFTERQGVLGKGPQIRVSDPTALSNRRLVRWVEDVAAAADIPIQRAVRRSGGTDAKSIHLHGQGVPTVVIGVPARYIHTHAAMIQWRDYEAAFRLLLALVPSLDEEAVAALTRFD
jgi:endoglucanase